MADAVATIIIGLALDLHSEIVAANMGFAVVGVHIATLPLVAKQLLGSVLSG